MKLVNKDTYYVGVNDHQIDLFEGHYIVPNGMAYNSYIIKDECIAIFDSVDKNFFEPWMKNIKEVLGNEKPTYLIVQHMEPDHSANIMRFLEVYPDTFLVGNAKTFKMLDQFFHKEIKHKLVVNDLDTLNLGNHILRFVFAPMVHWPEVMMTYDESSKTFFSADAFGKFGALDVEEEWDCEARRYYFGIVGKYGAQVQMLLKKVANYEIKVICPLHGPVLDKDLEHYLGQYNTWSSYRPEVEGVAIFYTSVYGHTKEAAYLLQKKLEAKGCPKTTIVDLAREDMAESVEDAFKYSHIVLATTTFNMGIFPFMNDFIHQLVERNYSNRIIGVIENGSWAPNAFKVIKDKLANQKNLVIIPDAVTIVSAMDKDSDAKLNKLADDILSAKIELPEEPKKVVEEKKTKWVCKICGYTYEGEKLPDGFTCPICKHPASDFEKE